MGANNTRPLLLLVAGAKGAIGSTLAVACATLRQNPEAVVSYLTTAERFRFLGEATDIRMAGWDVCSHTMTEAIRLNGVVPEMQWSPMTAMLDAYQVLKAPDRDQRVTDQVDVLAADIEMLAAEHPGARPVLVSLLPACPDCGTNPGLSLEALGDMPGSTVFQDVVYAMAAVRCGIPLVNFTPNDVALPAVVARAAEGGVPLLGRDGKTGQTYFKVVLASALKARSLYVDGWYSLNILGNADGENLMDPACAAGKLANKTDLLDDLLGYTVGERYGRGSHKVHIDYYPPRGDAKEAWDVIDLKGLFGLPMSLRLNLQGRDSILAAPMVIDLARWAVAAQAAGYGGLMPELGFFFKKPEGENPPLTFQDQFDRLAALGDAITERLGP